MPNVLLIENCDFQTFPVGGQLFFARQMMKAFGNRLALVGLSTDATPIGRWVEKEIDAVHYQFFSIGKRNISAKRPFIPERLRSHIELMYFKDKILSSGITNVFTQAPELLIAVAGWKLDHLCYQFPGVENPLRMPRYKWGKFFAGVFEKKIFRALEKVDTILACADESAIDSLVTRSLGTLAADKVIAFPTRVDTTTFFPSDKSNARKLLGLPPDKIILVATGRINKVKGWNFILESYVHFIQKHPDSLLVYLGDGEDRAFLEQEIQKFELTNNVRITGFKPSFQVAQYLNAADVCVVGSYKEGWSLAMLEALACGKPLVSTDVSGARDMIINGKNGFVITERKTDLFAEALVQSLDLEACSISLQIAQKYSLASLKNDMAHLWSPLCLSGNTSNG